MTIEHLPGVRSTLEAKGWARPRPGLGIDDLAGLMRDMGNAVIEIHRDCDCIGAGANTEDGGPDRDDHLLVIHKEVTL